MKVKVKLPLGYSRAYNGSKGFQKSSPTFKIDAFDDAGNMITERYPRSVQFGPDMYRLLNQILPGIAKQHNEGLSYEGDVEVKRSKGKKPPAYRYYGHGINPLTNTENSGIGFIGYGDDEKPDINKFGSLNGVPNFVYAIPNIEELFYSPKDSITKSAILTNILNASQDFSPLLAPYYEYEDVDFDPRLKTDRNLAREELARRRGGNISDFLKGPNAITADEVTDFMQKYHPKPTDNWVPRKDKETGDFMRKPDGSIMMRPILRIQDMPIYNFNHPMWKEDPEAAWNLVNDKTKDDWGTWGNALRYADYTGLPAVDDNGAELMRDYLKENAKLAGRQGYFEYAPDVKNRGHQKLRDIKGEERKQKLVDARKQKAEDAQVKLDRERLGKSQDKYAKSHIASEGSDRKDKYKNSLERGQFYNVVVHHIFDEGSDSAAIAKDLGITPDDEKAMKRFAKDNMEKYNKIDSDDAKRLIILKDFAENKAADATQSNILNGVKEPW